MNSNNKNNNNNNNNDNYILNKLKSFILSKNVSNFYQFIQESNAKEFNYILKNENIIENLILNQYKWEKGYKLWKLIKPNN